MHTPLFALILRNALSCIVLLGICYTIPAQNTYTWNVNTGNFLSPSSWQPARTNPANNDVLVFDGSVQANPTVNNIRTQRIARLRIINNANVNFFSAIPDTGIGTISYANVNSNLRGLNTAFLTQLRKYDFILDTGLNIFNRFGGEIDSILNDSDFLGDTYSSGTNPPVNMPFYIVPKLIIQQASTTVPGFEITAGARLQLNSVSPQINIWLSDGVFANIEGTLSIAQNQPGWTVGYSPTYIYSKLSATDSNAYRIKMGGKVTINGFLGGQIMGRVGTPNTIVFDSGATFEQIDGNDQFVYDYKNVSKKFVFLSGSNFIFKLFNTHIDHMTMGNVYYRSSSFGQTFSVSSDEPTTIENLYVDTGNLTINLLANSILNIKGDIMVNTGASLTIASNGVNSTVNFNGTAQQNIGGNGSININGNNTYPITFALKNGAGLSINRFFSFGRGKLLLDTGALYLNGNTLVIGTDYINYGNIKARKGFVTNGTITKWYPTNNLVTNNLDSTCFPFGITTNNRTLWITGNATNYGTISVTYNNLNGIANFTPLFNDSASSNVQVNARQNYAWQISTDSLLKGNNFTLRALGNVDNSFINMPTNIRLTLASNKAPGLALDGSGTTLLPIAIRNNLNATHLNNTFYLGAFSTACFAPPPPTSNNNNIRLCAGKQTTLAANGSGIITWHTDSLTQNVLQIGTNYTTPILQNSTYYYIQDSTCKVSARTKINIEVKQKPLLGFRINNKNQCINNNTFIFTDTSLVNINNSWRLWQFNNGDSITNQSITKTFYNTGTFTIKLIVKDTNNICTDSITQIITVHPKPLVLPLASDSVICYGKWVTLQGSGAKTYYWNNNVNNNIPFAPNASKDYTLIGIDSNNCADTAHYNIRVNTKPTVSISPTDTAVCAKTFITLSGNGAKNYIWSDSIINNTPFIVTQTKTYQVIGIDSNNCTDTNTIHITVKPTPNITTTWSKPTITANQNSAQYKWLNCNTNYSPINGATGKTYTPTVNGNYAVEINLNNCIDTSVCVPVNGIGINEIYSNPLSIYPNPNNGIFTISTTQQGEYKISNELGQTIQSFKTLYTDNSTLIDISNQPNGIYFLQFTNTFNTYTYKLVKQ